jgi:hypothetical protein
MFNLHVLRQQIRDCELHLSKYFPDIIRSGFFFVVYYTQNFMTLHELAPESPHLTSSHESCVPTIDGSGS